MKATKMYVGADSTEVELGGGAGSAINVSLYFDESKRMLIKCNTGEIQGSDSLLFARYVTRINGKLSKSTGTRVRYRGWVTPNDGTIEKYGLTFSMSLYKTEDGSDYWRVMLVNGDSVENYEEKRDNGVEEEELDEVRTKLPLSLRRRCGLAVVRDGVRISDYLHFCVASAESHGDMVYTATRW